MRPAKLMNLAWLRRRTRRSSRREVESPFRPDRVSSRGAFRGEETPRQRPRPRLEPPPRLEPLERRAYGPLVEMGKTLRIQALRGHRAAVIQLKPGLFLVTSVANETVRGEFSGVITAAMLTAANRASTDPQGAQQSAHAMQQGLQAMGNGVATTARWLMQLPPPPAPVVQPAPHAPVQPGPMHPAQMPALPPGPVVLSGQPHYGAPGPMIYGPVIEVCGHGIPRHQCGYCAWMPR